MEYHRTIPSPRHEAGKGWFSSFVRWQAGACGSWGGLFRRDRGPSRCQGAHQSDQDAQPDGGDHGPTDWLVCRQKHTCIVRGV